MVSFSWEKGSGYHSHGELGYRAREVLLDLKQWRDGTGWCGRKRHRKYSSILSHYRSDAIAFPLLTEHGTARPIHRPVFRWWGCWDLVGLGCLIWEVLPVLHGPLTFLQQAGSGSHRAKGMKTERTSSRVLMKTIYDNIYISYWKTVSTVS